MKNFWLLSLLSLGCWSGLLLQACAPIHEVEVSSAIAQAPTTPPEVRFTTQANRHSNVYILQIPANSGFQVVPALSPQLETVEEFAQKTSAIAVLNGGFFDPLNQKTTSYIVLQGELIADPQANERLMENPNLAPYLDRILNRSEFRRLVCAGTVRYAIANPRQLPPPNCQIVDALGGGPRLLPEMTLQEEGFLETENGQIVRDPLGIDRANARTAIGLTPNGDILWVMVAQKPDSSEPSGMSLIELAQLMRSLGAETALNLDGGSSSALYYRGQVFYGRGVPRPVHSVLLLQPEN
ncbi:MAG: phosphodiester glycosidase family protein [Desertifilum sp.]|nr:phosphodiester glycosidase family protein [Desertifilum sp.]